MLPLESFACVFLIQLQFVIGFHYFPYRECQKHLLGFVRYNSKLQVSKLRTITLPLGQKTSRLGALFSFLANYQQISTFEKPWLPIQREKKGAFHLKPLISNWKLVFWGRVWRQLCLLAAVLGVHSNIVAKIDEICLNLRRDVRNLGFSLHQEIREKQILACSYWKCQWALMKCSYKNKISHVDNAKGNVVRSEPHRILQMFLGTYSIGHLPAGHISHLMWQPLMQVYWLFVNWFGGFIYPCFFVF